VLKSYFSVSIDTKDPLRDEEAFSDDETYRRNAHEVIIWA